MRADAAGTHSLGEISVRVGRWVAAVLGECRQHDQGVGRGDGRVLADAGGARALGVLAVLVGRRIPAVLGGVEGDQGVVVFPKTVGNSEIRNFEFHEIGCRFFSFKYAISSQTSISAGYP